MDILNYECLEHIFSFLNYRSPKEWLLLSKVCTKWEDVVSKCWKRINRIEIVDGFDKNNPYLSSKKVLAIMEYAAQHISEITIIKRDKINSIRLGNYIYNSNCLDMDAILNTFVEYSAGKILKANVFPDNQKFLKYLMRSNKKLNQLTLTLDEHCFSCTHDNKDEKEVQTNSAPELQLIKHKNCTKLYCTELCGQVLESFPELRILTITFTSVNKKNLDMVEKLFSSLSGHPTTKEFQINVFDGTGIFDVVSLLSRYCCRETLEMSHNEDYEFSTGRWIIAQLGFDVTLTLQKTPFCFSPADETMKPPQTFFKLTSLTIRFGSALEYHSCFFLVLNYKVEEFCKLIDEIPTLQELKVFADTNWTLHEVKQLRDLLVHAINLAISNKKKIIINESIEIVEKSNSILENAETLTITMPLKARSIQSLARFLQSVYGNCTITSKL